MSSRSRSSERSESPELAALLQGAEHVERLVREMTPSERRRFRVEVERRAEARKRARQEQRNTSEARVAIDDTRPASRRRHATVPRKITYRKAVDASPETLNALTARPFNVGQMTERCRHCGALYFAGERANRAGVRLSCCKNNAYTLPRLSDCPEELRRLLLEDGPLSVEYRRHIRAINSVFAMASFKASGASNNEYRGRGPRCVAVRGHVCHFTEGVPDGRDLENPRLTHYYFLDAEVAVKKREELMRDRVSLELLRALETMLRAVNLYVRAFATMSRVLEQEARSGVPADDVILAIRRDGCMNDHLRRHGLPASESDIAAIFHGDEPPFVVDLLLYSKSAGDRDPKKRHHELKNLNPLADPMVYPLLFPAGDDGYSYELLHAAGAQPRKVTIREFYRYRLQVRADQFSVLHHSGKLFQQYIVDAWVRVEANQLWWYRQNQRKYRIVAREALRRYRERSAAAGREASAGRIGKAYVLPALFDGGFRNVRRRYLDAMTMVARHGNPDLFITFTCNPRWPEITASLEGHQRWENRPDLVCRVFKRKLDEFIDDVVNKQLYGVVRNYTYIIEFQTKGLPHAHIVVTFIPDDRLEDVEAVDAIISATIPDPESTPRLYEIIVANQLHCSSMPHDEHAACIQEAADGTRTCSKRFPRKFREETVINARTSSGMSEYRRPADGRTVEIRGRTFDNRWVVPYNPYASAKYQNHINFEVCGSLASIKYLHKYINKRSDATDDKRERDGEVVAEEAGAGGGPVRVLDEIKQYQDGRNVGAMEAAWRLFEFRMHERSHAVMVLPLHLPGEDELFFDEDEGQEDIERRLGAPSKLEAWFALNTANEAARAFKYQEIPEHFTWDHGAWCPRRQTSKMLGCIAEVSPAEERMEKFYLRKVLCHVRGATSFDHLLTFGGVSCRTFQEVCRRMNLFDHVDEFDLCLQEAALVRNPKRLRHLFAMVCCLAADGHNPAEMALLWRSYKNHLIDDFVYRGVERREALRLAAAEITAIVARNRRVNNVAAEYGIVVDDNDIEEETRALGELPDVDDEEEIPCQYYVYRLNHEQRTIFCQVMEAVVGNVAVIPNMPDDVGRAVAEAAEQQRGGNMFYVDGPGGTGKTYLYNVVLESIARMGLTGVAVAWTGIAAALLAGGTTAHKAFRLPLNIAETTVAGWPQEHPSSRDMRAAAIIVWDEAPMTPKVALHAVDRYLRDLTGHRESPMGGKVVVLGGDFRQTLPVVPTGGRNEIIGASLKTSYLWPTMNTYALRKNMRAVAAAIPQSDLVDGEPFAQWLLRLGEDGVPKVRVAGCSSTDVIRVPQRFVVAGLPQLLAFVYGGEEYAGPCAVDKVILTPTNAVVREVNEAIVAKLPGDAVTYFSTNSYEAAEDDNFYVPVDVLDAVSLPSLPPHELVLKVGCVVMLLRNLDVAEGLCNGCRMAVRSLGSQVIACEVLTGRRRGRVVYVPRVTVRARVPALPSRMSRKQFPLRVAYAMTINKAQGQTFSRVGVFLKRPCFSHGQLYVACSRVGSADGLRMFVEDGARQGSFSYRDGRKYTRNVVHRRILHGGGAPDDAPAADPLDELVAEARRYDPEAVDAEAIRNARQGEIARNAEEDADADDVDA
ncbi:hypothetical protein NQ318_004539 [Aromia moschata]|uniref:ATP-dependent DNA helicase n=1 Tax=Aromia moschata TaxID=1265417 RepID=A0AAV8XNU8_9CUCU|nr:hypothetical protein NQ318_004539 [Aromia moschata]